MPELDRHGGLPLYRQIADHLRDEILRGDLEPGERLPATRDLEERYGCAMGTIRQALGVLKSEGLVVARHGSGVYVRDDPPIHRLAHDRLSRAHRKAGRAAYLAEMEREGHEPEVEILEVGRSQAPAEIRERLHLDEDADVLVRRRRYLADDRPVQTATSYLPWDLVGDTRIAEADTGPGGIYARLEEMGHTLAHFTEEVRARAPVGGEARVLQLEKGVPVLSIVRTAYDTRDEPVEVCDTLLRADRFVLSYRLPAD